MLWIIGLLALLGTGIWAVSTGRRRRGWGGAIRVVAGVLVLAGAGWMAWLGWREADPSQLVGRLLACAAFFLLGLLIVLLGFRGWRVGTLPHCRACGFNLFGKPDSSTRCSECGADVTQTGAITVGNHRLRHDRILYGTIASCLALCVASSQVRRVPVEQLLIEAETAVNRLKSDRQLVRDLVSRRTTHDRLLRSRDELYRRRADPTRNEELIRLLCDEVLRHHHATGHRIHYLDWLLDQGYEMQRLSDDEIQSLVDATVDFTLECPAKLGRGLPVEMRLTPFPRLQRWEEYGMEPKFELMGLRVGPVSAAAVPTMDPYASDRLLCDLSSNWNQMPDGPTKIELRVRLSLRVDAGPGRSVMTAIERPATAWSTVVDATQVVPPLIKPTAEDQDIQWHAQAIGRINSDNEFEIWVRPSRSPNGRLCGRVDIRQDGVTKPFTYFEFPRGVFALRLEVPHESVVPRPFRGPMPFELVFTPDPSTRQYLGVHSLDPVLDLPFSVTVDPNQP